MSIRYYPHKPHDTVVSLPAARLDAIRSSSVSSITRTTGVDFSQVYVLSNFGGIIGDDCVLRNIPDPVLIAYYRVDMFKDKIVARYFNQSVLPSVHSNSFIEKVLGDTTKKFMACSSRLTDGSVTIPDDVKEQWRKSSVLEYYQAKTSYRLVDKIIESNEIQDFMVGVTFCDIQQKEDELIFKTDDGCIVQFWHNQDYCESVNIEDITGDLKDLIGSPMIFAYENTNHPLPHTRDAYYQKWTFYNFSTNKGSVTARWYGECNEDYSLSVSVSIRAWQPYTTAERVSPKRRLLH